MSEELIFGDSLEDASDPDCVRKTVSEAQVMKTVDGDCSVCMCPFNENNDGDYAIQLSECVGHYFHLSCAQQMVKKIMVIVVNSIFFEIFFSPTLARNKWTVRNLFILLQKNVRRSARWYDEDPNRTRG